VEPDAIREECFGGSKGLFWVRCPLSRPRPGRVEHHPPFRRENRGHDCQPNERGRAPAVDLGSELAATSRLRPGSPAAPERPCLPLLPSGPDGIHRLSSRRTRPSTLLDGSSPRIPGPRAGVRPRYSGLRVQGTASSPSSTTARHATHNANDVSRAVCPRRAEGGGRGNGEALSRADAVECSPVSSAALGPGSPGAKPGEVTDGVHLGDAPW